MEYQKVKGHIPNYSILVKALVRLVSSLGSTAYRNWELRGSLREGTNRWKCLLESLKKKKKPTLKSKDLNDLARVPDDWKSA